MCRLTSLTHVNCAKVTKPGDIRHIYLDGSVYHPATFDSPWEVGVSLAEAGGAAGVERVPRSLGFRGNGSTCRTLR